MKLKLMISCAITFVCLLHVAAALAKLDFSGTWVLDKNRVQSSSFSLLFRQRKLRSKLKLEL
ncbi:MAG: hypothetical protein DMF60_10315 [Acidobacteria bacterium]|nr:MAG: hypothetical protein DMF60_10315 [Acidobacteriota bacterium]